MVTDDRWELWVTDGHLAGDLFHRQDGKTLRRGGRGAFEGSGASLGLGLTQEAFSHSPFLPLPLSLSLALSLSLSFSRPRRHSRIQGRTFCKGRSAPVGIHVHAELGLP